MRIKISLSDEDAEELSPEEDLHYKVKDLCHALTDWVGGKTSLGFREQLKEALDAVFPKGHPFTYTGYAYRLWFEEYGIDWKNWKKYKYHFDDRAIFSSHCASMDELCALIRKYKVYSCAGITKVRVTKKNCFCYLPALYTWLKDHPNRGLAVQAYLPDWARVKSENEVLVDAVSTRQTSKPYGYVQNDTWVSTLDGEVCLKGRVKKK